MVRPPCLFVHQQQDINEEYSVSQPLTEIMHTNSVGIVTARDDLAIHWDRQQVLDTISDFVSLPEEAARIKYQLGADSRDWKVLLAQQDVKKSKISRELVTPILYRPFDFRYTYYTGQTRGFICMPRPEVMPHMIMPNVGLIISRQTRDIWTSLVTNSVCGHKACAAYDINYLFPLYLYPSTNPRYQTTIFDGEVQGSASGRQANLSPAFIAEFTTKLGMSWIADGRGDLVQTIGPEDVFHYTYAVFHSPTYRTRYAEFLKIDFPRLPLTSDINLFAALAAKGAALVDLHLLRLPGADEVGGNGGAAILQSPGKQGVSYPQGGSNTVEKVAYNAAQGRVAINTDQYFTGVGPETWAMRVGGYQPLDKWLKDRKGRVLSSDDVLHYMRVVIALRETQRLVGEIDSLIPAWPLT